MSNQEEELKQFIFKHLELFNPSSRSGSEISHPQFELFARDYIGFAEEELYTQDERSLINCISHLKRAIDCQLDSFLHAFNLTKLFGKRNLKFEKKLEFLAACGVFSARTLTRLNTIRNRMEHSYEIPKVADIEAYFDLTVAFVSVVERTILLAGWSELDYNIVRDEPNQSTSGYDSRKYNFYIRYDFDLPQIRVRWNIDNEQKQLVASTSDIEEFAYFFRVFVLLSQREALASDKYILQQL